MYFPNVLENPESTRVFYTWRWARYLPSISTKPVAESGKCFFYSAADAGSHATKCNSQDAQMVILYREGHSIPKASRLLLYVYAHLIDREIQRLSKLDCRFGLREPDFQLPLLLSQFEERGVGSLTIRYKYMDQAVDGITEEMLKDFYMQVRKKLELPYAFELNFTFLKYIKMRYTREEIPLPAHIPERLRDLLFHMCPY